MYLVVGLGNPGPEYENTRHNLGFGVINELARRLDIHSFKSKCSSSVAESRIGRHKTVLVRPQTFMNNSGSAVRSLLAWFSVDPRDLILIYDDVDLEVGQIRLREKGSAGGHRGVESVIACVGDTLFPRVRIGIGRDGSAVDTADYVLRNIPSDQKKVLSETVALAADAVESIICEGVPAAMNKFNK